MSSIVMFGIIRNNIAGSIRRWVRVITFFSNTRTWRIMRICVYVGVFLLVSACVFLRVFFSSRSFFSSSRLVFVSGVVNTGGFFF